MNLNDLYSYAEENNIPVISFDMPKSESMSVLYDGNCYVGIDRLTVKNETDEKEKLAHELRHAFASNMALLGIPESYAKALGGWDTSEILHGIYEQTFKDEEIEFAKKVQDFYK